MQPMEPVTPQDSEVTISGLLDDIAETRARMQRAAEAARFQRDLLNENTERLKHTFNRIGEQADLDFAEMSARRKPPQKTLLARLTAREIEVLRLIAEGQSTKQIAARLSICFKTAVCHRSHILEKLDCHESATLVRFALRAGLVA